MISEGFYSKKYEKAGLISAGGNLDKLWYEGAFIDGTGQSFG